MAQMISKPSFCSQRRHASPAKSWQYSIVLAAALFAHLYFAYRYPLQINSSVTSPTYSDTPVAFKVTRVAVALGIYALAVFGVLVSRAKKLPGRIVVPLHAGLWLFLLLLTMPLVIKYGVANIEENSIAVKAVLPIILAAQVLFVANLRDYSARLRKFVILLPFWYHTAWTVVQVGLYLAVGRLPALGYYEGLVRFGGGWDDPNSFAVWCAASCGIALYEISIANAKWYWVMYWLSAAQLVLAQSFSGGVALLIILFIALLIRPAKSVIWTVAITVVVFGLAAMDKRAEVLTVIELKSDSALSRLSQIESLKQIAGWDFVAIAFGQDRGVAFFENLYIIIVYNYGVVGLVLSGSVIGGVITKLCMDLRKAKAMPDMETMRNSVYALNFIVAIAVASFGIPSLAVYPINYFAWFLVFLTIGSRSDFRISTR
jgi:hypothetical protein